MTQPMQRHFVPNRLGELLDRSGGKTAEQALQGAAVLVEQMRDVSSQAIVAAVARLEGLISGSGPVALTPIEGAAVLTLADRIITLAATYGYDAMDEAAKSLADVVNAMSDRDAVLLEPVKVHIRAMRMLAPSGKVEGAIAKVLLNEIAKVHAHLCG